MTAPTVLLNPGTVWKLDSPAGIWRLLAFPHGDYTVRYSGFDYVAERNGERVGRRLTLQGARQAAEEDFNERVEAACQAAAEVAQADIETSDTAVLRNTVAWALRAALTTATSALPDPAKSQQEVARFMIGTVGDLLGFQSTEYDPHLTKET